ncbi:MAG TPA: DUF3142 domain-containing protein [Terracidiphilus sp.]|jgi:hypothetical protein|nr:DUF3142 domain-containing protein [Terracidiphilus sp.]
MPSFLSSKGILPALALLLVCLATRSDTPLHPPAPLDARLAALPRVTLWVWERREDLRSLDPHRYVVAYLDQTLAIDLSVTPHPRLNPVALPDGIARIAVVRIEPTRHAVLDDVARREAVAAILRSAHKSGIVALQIDFDATLSQRPFYRTLLVDLRRQMPSSLPLSITALASWCSFDDWLRGLPIDEAVPMYFRMEPDRRRAPRDLQEFRIREPLCSHSFGVSTTEPWPQNLARKRLYIFPDHGWSPNALEQVEEKLP